MTHFLLTDLSAAVKKCPGDSRHATEHPPVCDCDAHPWPHMREVSLRCTRRQFALRQWAERFNQQQKEHAA